ncbi:MAG: M3 family metallopeptidase [Mariprofundaceae bacterium]
MTENPLIASLKADLPLFEQVRPKHVSPALEKALIKNRAQLKKLGKISGPTWETLMQPLEEMEERLQRLWGPVTHLNAVCDSDELRPFYKGGLKKIAAYETELAQNEAVYAQVREIQAGPAFKGLKDEQQQLILHILRDFRLSGAELSPENKVRFKEIQIRLSELGTRFEQNLLDATHAFELHISEKDDLAGLPESVQAAAAQRAMETKKSGWLFTLDAPSYIPFMQNSAKQELRKQLYSAYVTRSSDGRFDNTSIMVEILQLRQESAHLLGFSNYGEYSLESKMADDTREVIHFLRELAAKSRSLAKEELSDLKTFAAEKLGLESLNAWDIAYASEQLRQQRYAYSQEDLKPYFPENKVIRGLFAVAEQLYSLTFRERKDIPRWHKSVRYFDIDDANGECIAGFYLDPYARAHKRGGAWMDECIVRWRRTDGCLQKPVAYLICNFAAPVGDTPALWTHEEVITLFHEFGHGLHHMLTKMETLGVSGIRGVPWDAVELPSQFMENYCWQGQALTLFANHFQTGESLPDALFEKMQSAKNFQAGLQMLRQVELALFDFLLHSEFDPQGNENVQDLLDQVRNEVAILVPPEFNRFQNSFSHIFAGGYAAGYYSYKWAEVLSADAFAAFEEVGIFDPETAQLLRDQLLAVGGSQDIMEAYVAFRGRKPTVKALLRHSGITDKPR